jgi:hypothetical protein
MRWKYIYYNYIYWENLLEKIKVDYKCQIFHLLFIMIHIKIKIGIIKLKCKKVKDQTKKYLCNWINSSFTTEKKSIKLLYFN